MTASVRAGSLRTVEVLFSMAHGGACSWMMSKRRVMSPAPPSQVRSPKSSTLKYQPALVP